MAQTKALKPLFDEIVDAIHEKDGQSDGIAAENFPARIRAIPSGGVFLESIEITSPPVKTVYAAGEPFDPAGMAVRAKFSNGETLAVSPSSLTFSPSGPLDVSVTSVTVSFQWGIRLASASVSIVVQDAVVFGVCWNYGDPPTALTRLTPETDPNGLVTNTVDTEPVPAVGTGAGSSPFDAFLPWSGMEEWNIADGAAKYKKGDAGFSRTDYDTMVYIPAFWYQCLDDAAGKKRYWYVSNKEAAGLAKHPGSGKYVARYPTGGGYVSKSGLAPLVSITRAQARTGSAAKGDGWHQFDFASYCAAALLYLVEFADWDSQEKIGVGPSSAASSGGTDSMVYHTGKANSGEACDTQYRGIENLWRFVIQFLDGINVRRNEAYICTDPSLYQESVGNGYTASGVSFPSSANVYIKKLGYSAVFPWAFIPSEAGGGIGTYIPDTTGSNDMPVNVGGAAATNAASTGLFRIMAYTGVGNPQAAVYFGTRLVWEPQMEAAQDE